MKRKLTFISTAFLLSAAFTLMSCGNDDENNNTAFITPDGKVDVTRAVEFRVNFGDYTGEEELQGTRAAKTEGSDTPSRQYVELDNGLLAEVTVQKDTAKTQTKGQQPVTRALDDDTYTMLAYKDGEFQGSVTGTVSSGVFRASPGEPEGIALVSGRTYDFVLFNSRVSRSGDNLTVNLSDVETAFIGRAQYEVTTDRNQQVTFAMKHAGSRLRIKLTGYVGITAGTAATLSSVDASSVPNAAVYDAATGTWSNGAGAATSGSLTFPASSERLYSSPTYTSRSNEYLYFLPSTNPSKLKLKFTGGRIYDKDMAGAGLTLSVPTLSSMAANGSYVINVKLMYSFLYLMSDGTTGPFTATTYGGGTKTPIGVVVRKKTPTSDGHAVALKDVYNGRYLAWSTVGDAQGHNSRIFIYGDGHTYGYEDAEQVASFYADLDGYKYTWEASGSADGTTVKANEQASYPAFYYAGHYGEELSAELAAQGKALSNGMETKKWHLPSVGEWKYYATTLGFGDGSLTTRFISGIPYYGNLVNTIFTQVGGTTPSYKFHWSSSEVLTGNHIWICCIDTRLENNGIGTFYYGSGQPFRVRAFIKY